MSKLTQTLIAAAICLPLMAACNKDDQKPASPAETAAQEAGAAIQKAGEAAQDAAVKTGEAAQEAGKEGYRYLSTVLFGFGSRKSLQQPVHWAVLPLDIL